MWNSSVHAVSDIDRLAYWKGVPQSDRIVPNEFSSCSSEHNYEQSTPAGSMYMAAPSSSDVSWNRVTTNRGRGALLENRSMVHRDNFELGKQLRLATGLGFSNTLIESKFDNYVPVMEPCPTTFEELGNGTHTDDDMDLQYEESTNLADLSDEQQFEDADTDDCTAIEPCEWVWEPRTANPLVGAFPKKNVALASIARHNKKAEEKALMLAESRKHEEMEPHKAVEDAPTCKVKEDWRAEIRAAEETQMNWRARKSQPLLAGLEVSSNWSMFCPSNTVENNSNNVPTEVRRSPEGSAAKSIFDLEEGDLPQRGKKKKKKKHLNVKPMFVPPEQMNGMLPKSNIHNTYGNLFQRAIQPLRGTGTLSFEKDSFNLFANEFPQLK